MCCLDQSPIDPRKRKTAMSLNHDVRLEIRHLKLLAAVAEQGSVTEAGRRLHVTQSALSHQLRDAEEKLGTALFLRLGKKMVLTPAGEKMLVCARKVLDELLGAEGQIAGLNGGTRGVIRVSTECYTCYHWLPPVLKKFHAKDRKSTRLNSSHLVISYAVFCLKKKQ